MANGFDFCNVIKNMERNHFGSTTGNTVKSGFQVDKKKNDLLSLVEIVPCHFLN